MKITVKGTIPVGDVGEITFEISDMTLDDLLKLIQSFKTT